MPLKIIPSSTMQISFFLFAVAAASGLSLPLIYASDGLRHHDKEESSEAHRGDGATATFSDWTAQSYPNFLSNDECDAIMKYHNVFNQEQKTDMHEKAVVPVSTHVAERIQNLALDSSKKSTPSSWSFFPLLMIHRTSYLHKDEDDAGMITTMVFLEDNDDAYFWIEEKEEKIAIEKGKMIAFDARFTHNTVINNGAKPSSVYLLGPNRIYFPKELQQVNRDLRNNSDFVFTNVSVNDPFLGGPLGNTGNFSMAFLKNRTVTWNATTYSVNNCPVTCNCQKTDEDACTPTPLSGKSGKV